MGEPANLLEHPCTVRVNDPAGRNQGLAVGASDSICVRPEHDSPSCFVPVLVSLGVSMSCVRHTFRSKSAPGGPRLRDNDGQYYFWTCTGFVQLSLGGP